MVQADFACALHMTFDLINLNGSLYANFKHKVTELLSMLSKFSVFTNPSSHNNPPIWLWWWTCSPDVVKPQPESIRLVSGGTE
jgi:hypothetical protein